MSAITTHVLDTARGCPAKNVSVALESRTADGIWLMVGTGVTDSDGRCRDLLAGDAALESGTYRLTFGTGAYHRAHGIDAFFPQVSIVFAVADGAQHYHVPLLLSPYGYSTYRGS
jgi:5-hydroxyisourate hydrolase